MLKILVADDFPLFRRGVRDLLVEGFRSVKIGEAGTVNEMLELARAEKWDAVVMDISMPGRCGPEAVRELKREHPSLPVLVLTMHPEEQYAVRMFRAGADGYLTKQTYPTELVLALKKVLTEGKYVSPSAGEQLALEATGPSKRQPVESLSDREYQVLSLIAAGKTRIEIAEELSLSVATINTYRARILEKLHLKNNVELTRFAIQHALVS
jgi:DNA-binding NarL/FixJ family response regulator